MTSSDESPPNSLSARSSWVLHAFSATTTQEFWFPMIPPPVSQVPYAHSLELNVPVVPLASSVPFFKLDQTPRRPRRGAKNRDRTGDGTAGHGSREQCRRAKHRFRGYKQRGCPTTKRPITNRCFAGRAAHVARRFGAPG